MTAPQRTPEAEPTACPVCGGEATRYCTKPGFGGEWHLDRCRACGYGFVVNRPTLDELSRIYSQDEAHLAYGEPTAESHARRKDARELAEQVARLARHKGPTLDVGCGDGGFSFHLQARGFGPPVMIDLDPRAARAATALVPGGIYRTITFEDLSDRAAAFLADVGIARPEPTFSAIVMSQVLEHALDPMDWLRRARGLLEDGGVLAIAVPNFGGVYRALGARDPFIFPPVHLNYFTPRALALALRKAGLEPLRMDSRSEVALSPRPGLPGLLRRAAAATWNAASLVLNPGARGIILRAFATPAPAAPTS